MEIVLREQTQRVNFHLLMLIATESYCLSLLFERIRVPGMELAYQLSKIPPILSKMKRCKCHCLKKLTVFVSLPYLLRRHISTATQLW